jgi:hypothetical protein
MFFQVHYFFFFFYSCAGDEPRAFHMLKKQTNKKNSNSELHPSPCHMSSDFWCILSSAPSPGLKLILCLCLLCWDYSIHHHTQQNPISYSQIHQPFSDCWILFWWGTILGFDLRAS